MIRTYISIVDFASSSETVPDPTEQLHMILLLAFSQDFFCAMTLFAVKYIVHLCCCNLDDQRSTYSRSLLLSILSPAHDIKRGSVKVSACEHPVISKSMLAYE